MTAAFIVFDILTAAVVGSFLNVVVSRVPKGESIVSPPSHCPNCGAYLRWYDNIPLISYLCLRGKCRNCRGGISFRYFAVEAANVLLWGAVILRFGLNFSAIVIQLALSAFIAIFCIDAENRIIPDSLVLIVAVLGAAACFLFGDVPWWERLAGGFGGFALFLLISVVFRALLKKDALGGGDIKFVGACGLLLGYRLLLLGIFAACIIACVWLLIMKLIRRPQKGEFAFAPFLTSGFAFSIFFGYALIDAYLKLFAI